MGIAAIIFSIINIASILNMLQEDEKKFLNKVFKIT